MVKYHFCACHSSTIFYRSSHIPDITIYIQYTLSRKDYKVKRMKLVDYVSNRISQTLFETNSISQEEIPIYSYCLSYFLESLIYCTYILLLAFISGQAMNGFLIILIFLPLKIFAGGYHAKTQKQCYFFSYAIVLFILFLVPCFHIAFTTGWIVLYTICSIFIVCLAPIDTPNKRLEKEKRKVLKKWTFFYMLFLTVLSQFLLWTNYYQNYIVLTVCICIINGNQLMGLISNWKNKKGVQKHDFKSSTL